MQEVSRTGLAQQPPATIAAWPGEPQLRLQRTVRTGGHRLWKGIDPRQVFDRDRDETLIAGVALEEGDDMVAAFDEKEGQHPSRDRLVPGDVLGRAAVEVEADHAQTILGETDRDQAASDAGGLLPRHGRIELQAARCGSALGRPHPLPTGHIARQQTVLAGRPREGGQRRCRRRMARRQVAATDHPQGICHVGSDP